MTVHPLKVRLRGHLRDSRRERTHRARWINALSSRGLKPVMVELEEVATEDRAAAERKWIAHYRATGARLVNATDGGEGTLGHRKTPEQRRMLGETSRLRFQDPLAREAVSRVHKGKTISDAHRRIVGEAAARRWIAYRASGGAANLSAESRARLSAAAKARTPHSQTPQTRARLAESKREMWADRKATGEDAAVRQRMREGIARSGKRPLSGFGTVLVDADGNSHGSTGYAYGCRCDVCRAARSAVRKLRAGSALAG
jgi:hypothetical protein